MSAIRKLLAAGLFGFTLIASVIAAPHTVSQNATNTVMGVAGHKGPEFAQEPRNPTYCDVAYGVFMNMVHIQGDERWTMDVIGSKGDNLKVELKHCGGLTGWNYQEHKTGNSTYFRVHAELVIGTRGCVRKVVTSAGGSQTFCDDGRWNFWATGPPL